MMRGRRNHSVACQIEAECRTLADSFLGRQVKVLTNVEGIDERDSYPGVLPRRKAPSNGGA